jgi:hypothetical protein
MNNKFHYISKLHSFILFRNMLVIISNFKLNTISDVKKGKLFCVLLNIATEWTFFCGHYERPQNYT